MRGMKDAGIIPECYVDTNLAETLTGIICNHQKGCASVVKLMKEKRADRFSLGIIDKDKRSVGYVDEFVAVAGNGRVQVLKHRVRHHYLVFIVPAVEGFMLDAAEELGVNLADFGLPTDLDHLKLETKQQIAKTDQRFHALFNALREASNFQLLRKIVLYLQEHPYSAEEEVIAGMFQ